MNKFMKILPFLIFPLFLFSCVKDLQPAKAPQDPGSELLPTSRNVEEANVYSLLLNEDPTGYIGNSAMVFIFNETEVEPFSFSDEESILEGLPTLNKETLANYWEINRQKQVIELSLSLNKPYEFISAEEINRRDAEDSEWFKTTVTTFSGIGFNDTLDQALVYMRHGCGGDCFIENLYLLVRNKYGWRIENILEGLIA